MAAVKIDEYVSEMSKELDALRADVKKADRAQLLPLDLSYESIDRAEDFYRLVLDKRVSGVNAPRTAERLVRYVGQTLIENAGGAWAAGPRASETVCVTKMKGAPKAQFLPTSKVELVSNSRFVGGLRERTEAFDLPLQKQRIAALTADPATTFQKLRADVKALTGKDPGPLEGDTASLDRLEPALLLVNANKADRDLRRRLRDGAFIYFGHVLQERVGKGEWSVEDSPNNADLGGWRMHGYLMARPLKLVTPKDPGALRKKMDELVVDHHGSKKSP